MSASERRGLSGAGGGGGGSQEDNDAGRWRRLYETILSNTPDLVYVFDRNHRFTYANDALLTMWGRTWDEAIGKTCLELGYAPDHAAMHDREIEQVIATRQPVRGEVPFTGTHGRRIYDYIFVPVLGADGEVEAVAGTTRDITERTVAEEGLRRSDGRHRFLADLAIATQPLTDPDEVMAVTSRLLGEYLGADRCAYAEVEEDENHFILTGAYPGNVPAIAGQYRLEDFGTEVLRLMRANEPVIVADVETDFRTRLNLDAYRSMQIRAMICVPLLKNGKLVAGMASHQKTPRQWTSAEIELAVQVVGQCWEAIERARVARSLQESEQRYRSLVQATASIVWSTSGDGSIVRELPSWEAFTGQTPDQYWGWGWVNALHPDDREKTSAVWKASLTSHTVYETSYRIMRHDGTYRHVIARGAPVLDTSGQLREWVGTCTDVTDRRKAEEQIARLIDESERQRRVYETALSNTADFNYVFDLQGRFTYVNHALLELWQKDLTEAVGKNFFDLDYPPHLAGRLQQQIQEVIRTGEPLRDETPYTSAAGTRFYEYILVPVFGAEDTIEAVAGSTRDITERKQNEEALREADQRKDEFLALLAHELRNPLVPLRNGLQVLRQAGSDPAARARAQDMMERQLAHMVRLIDDLLDISRISRNKLHLQRSRVSLEEVITSAVETARPLVEASGHQLHVQMPGEPVYLEADLTRLSQVFSNLLTNSAKYTRRGGSIWLTARCQGEEAIVQVRDNGLGIPEESLRHIFEMFSQVDGSLDRSEGGLGVGLAIVKNLVEMHGGTVEALSDGAGKGSTFTVRLPALTGAPDPAPSGQEDGTPRPSPRRRILVADDSRDAAESMAMLLGMLGNEVATAHDGAEAVEVAERFRPELILMDVGMPRLNGYDATRRIRATPWGEQVTIIALTGWGQQGDRDRSSEAGCNGHLVKPIELPDLEKLLADLASSLSEPSSSSP